MVPHHCSWDFNVVNDIFKRWDIDFILQIPFSTRRDNNLWYWLANPRDSYTVRSCYKLLDHISIASNSNVWHRIWNLKVPGKVKNFIWCAAMNVLSTADNLIHRRVKVFLTCYICNASIETLSYVL